jgi:malonyl-CoA/methylmalonyl-CoA synthetase
VPAGIDLDPTAVVQGESLPALWRRRWAADPTLPVLRIVGVAPASAADPANPAALDGHPSVLCRAGELDDRTTAAAMRLAALGVRPGERVMVTVSTRLEAIVAMLGALRLGAAVVPANPGYTRRELAHMSRQTRPVVAVVAGPEQAEGVAAGCDSCLSVDAELVPFSGCPVGVAGGPGAVLDDVRADDPALIVFTSGTTGAPKGAVLSHANLVAGLRALFMAWRWSADDTLVSALPLFHVHGLCAALFGSLVAGRGLVVLDRFDPAAVEEAGGRFAASMFFGVPTMYHRLAATDHLGLLGRLRLCVSGSAPLPETLWHHIRERAGAAILERYGMTETMLTVSNPFEGERRPGSVGLALPGVELELDRGVEADRGAPLRDGRADERVHGELLVRGPSVFGGYWQRPAGDACFVDGWFRTGDLVEVASDGYVTVRGRASELIISGGYNVYPAEVEEVLSSHPGVAEVAVTGVASEEWGQTVTAWVVPDGDRPDERDLVAFAAERLAPYKRPRTVRFVDSLPRNALGKVVRSELR